MYTRGGLGQTAKASKPSLYLGEGAITKKLREKIRAKLVKKFQHFVISSFRHRITNLEQHSKWSKFNPPSPIKSPVMSTVNVWHLCLHRIG